MLDKPLLLSTTLRHWQRFAWSNLGSNNIFLNHRRSGKSFFLTIVASYLLYLTEDKINIGIFAPTRSKAYKLLFTGVKDLLESNATAGIKFNKSDLTIENTQTGSKIHFFALSSENGTQCRGYRLEVVLIDEVDEVSEKELLESALPTQQGLEGTQQYKLLILSGTVRGSHSALTSMISKYRPLAPDLSSVNVSETSDLPTIVSPDLQVELDNSQYRFFHLPVTATNLISEEQLKPDRILMGEATFAREWLCSLTASSDDVLFNLADLADCVLNHNQGMNLRPSAEGHINFCDGTFGSYRAPSAGLDIARSGDGTTLYIRAGSVPLFIGYIKTPDSSQLSESNMLTQISAIQDVLLRYGCERIACDAGGIGAFMVDALVEKLSPYGIDVQAVQGQQKTPYLWAGSHANMRSCLYGLLAASVKANAPLPDFPALHEELSATTLKELPHDSRIMLIGKDKVKARLAGRSPDWADCVALSYFCDADTIAPEQYVATLQDIVSGRVNPPSLHQIAALAVEEDSAVSDGLWGQSLANCEAR